MSNKIIKSVSDLVKHLRDDMGANTNTLWYRGHSISSWKLESSYDRLKNPPKETNLVNEFRQNANYLLDKHTPQNDFDWLFLMQHYGVPTRLLDWTESPLIALYFAVETETRGSKNKDGALWLLDPAKLNMNTNASNDDHIPAFEEDEYMDDFKTRKFDAGRNDGLKPIAAIATRNNPRIQAQLGAFTISRSRNMPIEEVGDKSHVIQYIIPFNSKQIIALELKLLGLGKFQVFPELASIGEMIKRQYK